MKTKSAQSAADAVRPRGPAGVNCPLYRKSMSLVCHKCALWVGIGPEHAMAWNCAYVHSATYAFEAARQTFAVGAAVESSRNEAVRMHVQTMEASNQRAQVMEREDMRIALQAASAKLIGSN